VRSPGLPANLPDMPEKGALVAPANLVAVILAGGSGTRLWPRSRSREPKHLSPLAPDGSSLLRHAYDRAARLGGDVLVVTAVNQAAQVLAAIPSDDAVRRPGSGVVALGALVGLLVFRERLSRLNLGGIALALLAVAMIAHG